MPELTFHVVRSSALGSHSHPFIFGCSNLSTDSGLGVETADREEVETAQEELHSTQYHDDMSATLTKSRSSAEKMGVDASGSLK